MNPKCRACNAELTPGTSFCRQCGAAINHVTNVPSEGPTAPFGVNDLVATQRLNARSTADRGLESQSPQVVFSPAPAAKGKSVRRVLIAGAIVVIAVVCVLCAALFISLRGGRNGSRAVLVYPGSRTIFDMKYDDGSRAMTLETADPLNQVEGWYQSNLKPSKVIRLTTGSVVLKNQNTTATLVVENDKTNILIKMTP